MDKWSPTAKTVLAEYGIHPKSIVPFGNGLINVTLRVEAADGERFILQRLHPVFPAGINDTIDVVTRHLEAKGLPTPRLVQTRQGRLHVEISGSIWRLLSYVDGRTFDSIDDPVTARAAGELLARFHIALADLAHEFREPASPAHDLERHLEDLQATLQTCSDHPLYEHVKLLSTEVFELTADIPTFLTLSDRVVHGDPKISNLLFRGDPPRAHCMLDLDTLTRMPLAFELGDAFRSWCNPCGEDAVDTRFSIALFEAALNGYAEISHGFINDNEWQAIVPATRTIMVELAARFCNDTLRESYFGWDSERFSRRGEHNLVRAAGQLNIARSLANQVGSATSAVEQAFRPARDA